MVVWNVADYADEFRAGVGGEEEAAGCEEGWSVGWEIVGGEEGTTCGVYECQGGGLGGRGYWADFVGRRGRGRGVRHGIVCCRCDDVM